MGMSQSSPESSPNLTNAQVTGGGGHEPDPAETGPDGAAREPAAGSGVDMKSESLPEDSGG